MLIPIKENYRGMHFSDEMEPNVVFEMVKILKEKDKEMENLNKSTSYNKCRKYKKRGKGMFIRKKEYDELNKAIERANRTIEHMKNTIEGMREDEERWQNLEIYNLKAVIQKKNEIIKYLEEKINRRNSL